MPEISDAYLFDLFETGADSSQLKSGRNVQRLVIMNLLNN
jgi:hypothetical protein